MANGPDQSGHRGSETLCRPRQQSTPLPNRSVPALRAMPSVRVHPEVGSDFSKVGKDTPAGDEQIGLPNPACFSLARQLTYRLKGTRQQPYSKDNLEQASFCPRPQSYCPHCSSSGEGGGLCCEGTVDFIGPVKGG